jgi:hypothetical protein
MRLGLANMLVARASRGSQSTKREIVMRNKKETAMRIPTQAAPTDRQGISTGNIARYAGGVTPQNCMPWDGCCPAALGGALAVHICCMAKGGDSCCCDGY